jgi:hypothetical protein
MNLEKRKMLECVVSFGRFIRSAHVLMTFDKFSGSIMVETGRICWYKNKQES